MWGTYFCMGAYKRDVVVVIQMGAYIHGVLFCVSAYYPNFTIGSICIRNKIVECVNYLTHC